MNFKKLDVYYFGGVHCGGDSRCNWPRKLRRIITTTIITS